MMRTQLLSHSLLALVLAAVTAPVLAQEDSESSADKPAPLKLFRDAYEITKTADSAEDYDKIIELCQEGIELNPSGQHVKYGKTLLAWAQNRRGEALARQGSADPAKTLAAFEAAVANDPSKWKYYHNRSVSYAESGQLEKALADVNKVLEMQPNFATAHYNRGELYFQLGRLEDAINSYNQTLRISPRDSAAYNSRGFVHYRRGNTRAAEQDFNRAIQLNSDNVEAYVNRGNLYLDRGRFNEGARDLQRARSLNDSFGPALISEAWFRATCPAAVPCSGPDRVPRPHISAS